MRSFSKLIRAGERLHEFNFRQLTSVERKYHVDVPDGRGNRIVFYMNHEGDGWKIQDEQLPEWIQSVEEELSRVIEEEDALLARANRR